MCQARGLNVITPLLYRREKQLNLLGLLLLVQKRDENEILINSRCCLFCTTTKA